MESVFFLFGVVVGAICTFVVQRSAVDYYRRAFDLELRRVRLYEEMFPDYVRDAVARRVLKEVSRGK